MENIMNLSERLRVDKELFTMNLSERLRVDKELFTMNLSERLRVDKELFLGERRWYENIINKLN